MNIDENEMQKWEAWSKRDDAWKLFVPSDIRQMLAEIRRHQERMKEMAKEEMLLQRIRVAAKAASDAGGMVHPILSRQEAITLGVADLHDALMLYDSRPWQRAVQMQRAFAELSGTA